MTSRLRVLGSALLVIGYYILLNHDTELGVLLRICANLLSLPWAIENRIWDLVAILGLFLAIEVHSVVW